MVFSSKRFWKISGYIYHPTFFLVYGILFFFHVYRQSRKFLKTKVYSGRGDSRILHEKISKDLPQSRYEVILPERNLYAAIDALKVCDFVIFTFSPFCDYNSGNHLYDEFGLELVDLMKMQGTEHEIVFVSINYTDEKPKPEQVKQQSEYFRAHFNYLKWKIFDGDDEDLVRHVKIRTKMEKLKSLNFHWRRSRGYLSTRNLVIDREQELFRLEGVSRGIGFSKNLFVHFYTHSSIAWQTFLTEYPLKFLSFFL